VTGGTLDRAPEAPPAADPGAGLAEVAAALQRMPAAGWDVPDQMLVSHMRQLVQLRAMLDAALAERVAAFDTRAAARYDGQTSTTAWLRARLRLGGGPAGQLLLVARRLSGMPLVGKALAAGEITLEHAAAVAALTGQVGEQALAGYEPILLDLARQAPPDKLRIACAHLRQLLTASDGDGDPAGRQREGRFLSTGRTVDGMVHLQGLLDPAAGDVVLTALRAATPVPAQHDQRSATQRRADALVDVCAGWLASGESLTNGGLRPQVQVTVSLRALRDQPGHPDGNMGTPLLGEVPVLADGQPVTPGQARRLACDASVVPVVLGSDSEPLDIGRLTRVVPTGMRRALGLRDGGCRFPGCDRPTTWCDAHHLHPWADGGATSLDNLILLCAHHHTLVHERWRPRGHPGTTMWFQRPDGTTLDLPSNPRGQPPTRGP
jgi:hypothetical protein